MTIQYLVTGREGMSNWEYTASSAITKTYGIKEMEDICKESSGDDDVTEEELEENILEKFSNDCIRDAIDGEEDWSICDYQDAYREDDANLWNCVDLILKIDFKSEAITTIYEGAWDND